MLTSVVMFSPRYAPRGASGIDVRGRLGRHGATGGSNETQLGRQSG